MSWTWRQRTGLELVQVMTKEMLRSVNKLLWCESESGSGEVEVLQQEETPLRQDVYWVFWLLLFYSCYKTLLPYKKEHVVCSSKFQKVRVHDCHGREHVNR